MPDLCICSRCLLMCTCLAIHMVSNCQILRQNKLTCSGKTLFAPPPCHLSRTFRAKAIIIKCDFLQERQVDSLSLPRYAQSLQDRWPSASRGFEHRHIGKKNCESTCGKSSFGGNQYNAIQYDIIQCN